MTKEELQVILEKHQLWLEGSGEGERANLSYADLSYANLSDADLSDADLSCANLTYANLSYANLTYANLSGAYLSGADLSGAYLSKVRGQSFITVGNIGSRNAQTIYHVDTDTIYCGCWKSNLDDFEKRIVYEYDDTLHGQEYKAAIIFIRTILQIKGESKNETI